MNNKILSLVSLSLVLLIAASFVLTSCTTVERNDTTTATVSSEVATVTATSVDDTQGTTIAPDSNKITFAKEYVPTRACDENGGRVELGVVYGSYFLTYGGSISIDSDEFTADLSAKGIEKGTISIEGDGVIKLVYENGRVAEGTFVSGVTDADGCIVLEFTVTQGNYKVTFSCV